MEITPEHRAIGYYVEKVVECDRCKGTGTVKEIRPFTYNVTKDVDCYGCNGSGKRCETVKLEDALRDLGVMEYEDMRDDPEYQKFEQEVAKDCTDANPPCDGCLAGGMCDDHQEDDIDYWYEDGEPIGGNS